MVTAIDLQLRFTSCRPKNMKYTAMYKVEVISSNPKRNKEGKVLNAKLEKY